MLPAVLREGHPVVLHGQSTKTAGKITQNTEGTYCSSGSTLACRPVPLLVPVKRRVALTFAKLVRCQAIHGRRTLRHQNQFRGQCPNSHDLRGSQKLASSNVLFHVGVSKTLLPCGNRLSGCVAARR